MADQVMPVLAMVSQGDILRALSQVEAISEQIQLLFHSHEDGFEHLEQARLVILEYRMAKGYADLNLISKIRSQRPLMPILVFCINANEQFAKMVYESGANEYYPGPFDPEVLAAKLQAFAPLSEAGQLLELKQEEVAKAAVSLHKSADQVQEVKLLKEAAELRASFFEQTKAIMDALNEGLFFIESDLKVGAVVSAKCSTIFGRAIENQPLIDILPLKSDRGVFMEHCLSQVFDNVLPENISLSLVPKEVETVDDRILHFEFCATHKRNRDIDKIVVRVNDVTKELEAQKEAAEKERINRCLINILKDKEHFFIFLEEFKRLTTDLKMVSDVKKVKFALHTLKGGCASFGFVKQARFVHDCESYIADMDEEQVLIEAVDFSQKLESMMRDFLSRHVDILQIGYDERPGRYVVDEQMLLAFKSIADHAPSPTKEDLEQAISHLKNQPVSLFMNSLRRLVAETAAKLKKQVDFVIEGEQTRVDVNRLSRLFQCLVHPLNNACDHGLESPGERKVMGKNETGNLLLRFGKNTQGAVTIEIIDDGAGVNCDKLKQLAIDKGLATAEAVAEWSEAQTMDLLFIEGLSSKTSLDATSGRGVGMGALKSVVQDLGGYIGVKSERHKGTHLSIILPHSQIANDFENAILICEDEDDLRVLYRAVLQETVTAIDECATGLDGLLALAKRNYDLVVTDLRMPGLNGQQLIEKIRGLQKNNIPILVVSAYISDEIREDMQRFSNVYLLDKGFEITTLRERVMEILMTKEIALAKAE